MADSGVQTFSNQSVDPPVHGFLHRPDHPHRGLVLTHGAGGNSRMALLVALAETFADAGFAVLRCDMPFRQARPYGPPRPSESAKDRMGLKNAVAELRKLVPGHVFLGGQSYGGRQASMLCADEPDVADGLLLLSYPLHAPGKPDQLRTQHLPKLRVPVLFVQGTKDPFGSIEEMQAAIKLVPAKTSLFTVDNAGHDLGFKGKVKNEGLPKSILGDFHKLFGSDPR